MPGFEAGDTASKRHFEEKGLSRHHALSNARGLRIYYEAVMRKFETVDLDGLSKGSLSREKNTALLTAASQSVDVRATARPTSWA